jgi:acylphosphatase
MTINSIVMKGFACNGAVIVVDILAHVVFKGRVQGVFFRASTKEVAVREGVKGWVRNLPDGSVEAVFEGPEAKVMKVVELCKTAFPRARVDSADVQTEQATGAFKKFEVRH